VLTYTATMADDSALPDWLIFDSETLTFTATFPQKGMYEIVLIATDRNGDKAWCSIIFRYEYAVSVELTNETQFNLYPNPSTGMFTVQTEEVGRLTIFDALGKVMIEKQLNDKWNKINASQLPQGVYFAELKTAGGTYYRKVLITR